MPVFGKRDHGIGKGFTEHGIECVPGASLLGSSLGRQFIALHDGRPGNRSGPRHCVIGRPGDLDVD